MLIKIKTFNDIINLSVDDTDTINDIKNKLKVNNQQLYYNDKLLENNSKISDYNFNDDDVINLYNIKIIKRDSSIEEYDIKKIENVLFLSFENSNTNCNNMEEIIKFIDNEIKIINNEYCNIEDIQDIVEKTLMVYKYYNTAKHYINYRNDRNKKRKYNTYVSKIKDDIETPWSMLGYVTYKRTYSRLLHDEDENDQRTEEFRDTILRVLNACQNQLKVGFTNNELKNAYKYFKLLKGSVAGRFLWQLGTKTVDKLGTMSLQNCAFTNINEPILPFLWIFDVLMLGTGVGFNIQKENVNKIPKLLDVNIDITRLDTKDADFIVPDSREGWVSLLEKILEAFFFKGKSFTYSTLLIRSSGTKIKGFGGVASGPEDLVKGLKNIINILKSKRNNYLSTIDCLDIVNIIATIVVAGNVRRCLPKGSKIFTRKGLINIEDIIIGDDVLTSDGTYSKVIDFITQGKQKIVKIKTEHGYFKCTREHKMAVYNNNNTYIWKKAKDLKPNDVLLTTRVGLIGDNTLKLLPIENNLNRKDRINIPDFTKDVAWFFGFFYGNGSINNNSIKITVNNEILLEKCKSVIKKFGDNIHIIIDINKIDNIYSIECVSDNLTKYFNNYIKCNDIYYFINETSFDNRLEYIRGVIESYMCEKNDNIFIISQNNFNNWMRSFQILCYSCGFETKFVELKDKYKLYIDSDHSISVIKINIDIENTTKFIQSKIINISEDDFTEYDTYDITVRDKHEFYCDGYLTHNSALIAIGDCDDIEYLNAKNWGLGNIPNWRCMSNNSVVCNDISKLPKEFWNSYDGSGEPYGLINLELSRKIGRIKDGDKYPDPLVDGYNPCGEICCNNFETCCLSEIFLPNIKTLEELKELGTILYRICKHSLTLQCHQKNTENVVHKNMRIGVGITGYMMATKEQKDWLSPFYEYLREYDIEYSKKINVPISIKLTTVKPSGTLSILGNVTPGCHPAIYKYYIRRIRISSSNHNLINVCIKNGYHVEYQQNFDGTNDLNTKIIEFPCTYGDNCILAEDLTAIDQLNVMKELQTNYSDNSVSITVYYKLEELEDVKKWLSENYNNNVKTVSFLLHQNHGFKQAPYEEITKEKYLELMSKVKPITSENINIEMDLDNSLECEGGHCPIR